MTELIIETGIHDAIARKLNEKGKLSKNAIGVRVAGYYLQRMKTKWGSCKPRAGNVRLNTELVKNPQDLVEYVVVHESCT